MNEKICPGCGTKNTESARFCKKCGHSLEARLQESRPVRPIQPPPPPPLVPPAPPPLPRPIIPPPAVKPLAEEPAADTPPAPPKAPILESPPPPPPAFVPPTPQPAARPLAKDHVFQIPPIAADAIRPESPASPPPPPPPSFMAATNLAPPMPMKAEKKSLSLETLIPLIASVLATKLFHVLIAAIFPYSSYFHRLFLPGGGAFQQGVPTLTIALFFWVFTDLIIKAIKTSANKRQLKNRALQGVPSLLLTGGLVPALAELERFTHQIRKSPAFRRIYALLQNLKSSDNAQRSHDYFRHQSEIETDTAMSAYTTARTFIWAMPILGFIGTVIGIGISVGDFSGFLTGDIEDLELVKTELSKVAKGLSYAFDTTLLGLATALISMLLTAIVQREEENFLTEVEELGLNVLSNFKSQAEQPSQTAPAVAALAALPDWEKLTTHINALVKSVDNFSSAFSTSALSLNEKFAVLPEKIAAHENLLKANLEALSVGIAASVDQLKNSHNALTSAYLGEISKLPALMQAHEEQTREIFQKDLEVLSGHITQSVQKLTEGYKEAVKSFAEGLPALPEQLSQNEQFIRGKLQELGDYSLRFKTILEESADQFKRSSDLVAESVGAILPAQEVTAQAVKTLATINHSLKEMQETQVKIIALLSSLSGPLEFRLVPAQPAFAVASPKSPEVE